MVIGDDVAFFQLYRYHWNLETPQVRKMTESSLQKSAHPARIAIQFQYPRSKPSRFRYA